MRTAFILLIGWALPLARAESPADDSTRVYQAADVVVTATRSRILAADSPTPLQVLTAADFFRANGGSVADVLQSASGVFLKDYGSEAQLKTISLRGLGSEHVLVLLNGTRINSVQNGLVDFSLLPLENIERIELVRGGSSALYGVDALGGVINLVTRNPSPGLHVRADAGRGSYGYERYAADLQAGFSGGGIGVGFVRDLGLDEYPFRLHQAGLPDTTVNRSDADFSRTTAYVNARGTLDDRTDVRLSFERSLAERGTPGPVKSASDRSNARQSDRDTRVTTAVTNRMGNWLQLQLSGGYQTGRQTYVDPAWMIDSHYESRSSSINPQAEILVASFDRLVLGGEYVEATLDGNDFDGTIKRRQSAVYVSNEYSWERAGEILDRILFYQTARYDRISDAGGPLHSDVSPKIGVNVRLLKEYDLRIRASYGKNFRAPSFNDLYYRGFSNPNLMPERSTSLDVGLLTTVERWGIHSAEATFFQADVTDRILFDPVRYVPVNIGKVESRGIEARYEWRPFSGAATLSASVTLTDAVKKNRVSAGDSTFGKQLPYIPMSGGTLAATVQVGRVSLHVTQILTGMRYTLEDNSRSLPGYALTNANANVSFRLAELTMRARVEISNVFGRDYRVFEDYPMPGRTWRFSVGVDY